MKTLNVYGCLFVYLPIHLTAWLKIISRKGEEEEKKCFWINLWLALTIF